MDRDTAYRRFGRTFWAGNFEYKIDFLNMKEACSFETSLIYYRSTRTCSTAAIYDQSIIVFHVLFIESNRMAWYSDEAVVFKWKITVANIARVI